MVETGSLSRRTALGMGLVAMTGVASARTTALVVGQVNLSFYAAAGGVVLEVLERLGHATLVVEAPHAEIYDRLGRGEADILVAAWLPHAHGPLHAPLAADLVEAAVLYDNALLYWSVPAHISTGLISSIGDLAKPAVLERMDREIVGVGPGSGLMRSSQDALEQYGLAKYGYRLSVASPSDWSMRLAAASASGRAFVMPLWRPHHLNALHAPRPLTDPLGVFGVDRAMVVVRKSVWAHLSERSRTVLARMTLGIDTVTELDRRVVIDGVKPRVAARAWMYDNPATVRRWFGA